MATKAANSGALSFGTFAAQTVVTHIRYRFGSTSGTILATDALSSSVTVQANQELQVPIGGMSLRWPKGDMEDVGIRAMVEGYLDANALVLEAMTSATQVVTTSGYAAVSIAANTGITWTTEND